MANEIKVLTTIQCDNGNFSLPQTGKGTQQITQAVAGGGGPGTILCATTGTDIPVTGLTAPGWTYIKNLDVANSVQIGPKLSGTFYPLIKLKPGRSIVLPLEPAVIPSTTTLHIKANTSAVLCQVNILDS